MRYTKYLIDRNSVVFSPILHAHDMAEKFDMPKDAYGWYKQNSIMLRGCGTLHILNIKGARRSVGLYGEVVLATELEKSILIGTPIGRDGDYEIVKTNIQELASCLH